MSALELRNVTKQLGDHKAVDGVSFRVEAGQFFVLLGSSGCGKTTTLRMICGLETPDSGSIVLDGEDITRLRPRDRNLGMVFQEYGLYPSMDVRGNIAYGLEARGHLDRAEIDRRVRSAAAKLGLSDRLGDPTQTMSGGEQQRVALARALVKDARAYLFDEPLSNLDPKLRHQARRDIVAVHRDKLQPSVYVTHDQGEAFAMADVVAVMSGGRIAQVGTPDDLLDRPRNAFVARFVGDAPMNIVTADVDRHDPSTLGTAFGPLPVGEQAARRLAQYDKDEVLLGFRPGDARPATSAGAGPAFGGRVDAIEFGLTELIVTIGGPADEQIVVHIEDETDPVEGETMNVTVDPDRVHLFDAVSHDALGDD